MGMPSAIAPWGYSSYLPRTALPDSGSFSDVMLDRSLRRIAGRWLQRDRWRGYVRSNRPDHHGLG
jgi:hypothetical protein